MQDLDILNKPGIDEVACRVGKTANIKMIGQGHSVDDDRNPIATDAANIDAFRTESRTRTFIIDAWNITQYITYRRREFIVKIGARQNRYVGGDFSNRTFVFVRDNDNLINSLVCQSRQSISQDNDRAKKHARYRYGGGRKKGTKLSSHVWFAT